MDYGERSTGTRDEHYNLVSVLYHALQGAENCDRYAADAELTGDEHLVEFFRDAQAMQAQLAERSKELLGTWKPRRSSAPLLVVSRQEPRFRRAWRRETSRHGQGPKYHPKATY